MSKKENYNPQFKVVSYRIPSSEENQKASGFNDIELPYETDQIELAFNKVGAIVSKLSKNLSRRIDPATSKTVTNSIGLREKGALHLIDLDDIEYCHGDGDYTKFYIKDRTPILFSDSIGKALDLLDERVFIKPHKSWIINTNFVASFKSNMRELVLRNGVIIPISRTNVRKLKKYFKLN